MTLNVTRTGNTTLGGSVAYSTSDGSASGANYTPASGTLTFAAGETTKPVTISLSGDPARPASSTFTFNLSSPGGSAVIGSPASATVTVTNSRSAVSLPATVSVTGADGSVTITVTRTGNLSVPASLSFATQDVTAAAGAAYTASSGTLSFAAGEASKDIVVPVLRNDGAPATSDFKVVLSAPAAGTVIAGPTESVVTVQNLHSVVDYQAGAATVFSVTSIA